MPGKFTLLQSWQPIETAPVDDPILATDPSRGYLGIVQFNKSGEWEMVNHNGVWIGIGFYPTHWMPLPKLPVALTSPKETNE